MALNAANEVAVAAFLEKRVLFPGLRAVVAGVVEAHRPRPADTLAEIHDIDREARREARRLVPQR